MYKVGVLRSTKREDHTKNNDGTDIIFFHHNALKGRSTLVFPPAGTSVNSAIYSCISKLSFNVLHCSKVNRYPANSCIQLYALMTTNSGYLTCEISSQYLRTLSPAFDHSEWELQ